MFLVESQGNDVEISRRCHVGEWRQRGLTGPNRSSVESTGWQV